jgi:hypothetical protein
MHVDVFGYQDVLQSVVSSVCSEAYLELLLDLVSDTLVKSTMSFEARNTKSL